MPRYDVDDEYLEETEPPDRAVKWGINGSILVILILTLIYVLFPVDAIPDLIPVAGQLDDLGVIAAGGGSIIFLTALRFLLRTRAGRWGCIAVLALALIGALAIFWVLVGLFSRL